MQKNHQCVVMEFCCRCPGVIGTRLLLCQLQWLFSIEKLKTQSYSCLSFLLGGILTIGVGGAGDLSQDTVSPWADRGRNFGVWSWGGSWQRVWIKKCERHSLWVRAHSKTGQKRAVQRPKVRTCCWTLSIQLTTQRLKLRNRTTLAT